MAGTTAQLRSPLPQGPHMVTGRWSRCASAYSRLVRRMIFLGLLLSLGGLGGLVRAQSLGEAARREQEKKKPTSASPATTYTDEDLKSRKRNGKGSVSELPVTGGPSPAASASASPSPAPDRALLERQWRARFREARARIAEADARAYEERVEVVYVSGIPVQQKVRVKVETPELIEAKKALDDLEEELRRSGGLPGWGRE